MTSMLCDRCKRDEATVSLETINGTTVTSTHLCEACATAVGVEHGAKSPFGGVSPDTLVAIVTDVERRGDPDMLTALVARVEHYARESPHIELPAEIRAFLARHSHRDTAR